MILSVNALTLIDASLIKTSKYISYINMIKYHTKYSHNYSPVIDFYKWHFSCPRYFIFVFKKEEREQYMKRTILYYFSKNIHMIS